MRVASDPPGPSESILANYLNQTRVGHDFSGKRFAIVVSRYHAEVTDSLLQAALHTLAEHDIPADNVDVLHVPGAWELALGTQAALGHEPYDGVVALGAVIQGETTHDQHINRFVSNALGQLSLESGVPIGFGLLTCNSLEQAQARSGGAVGNKGLEATTAMLDMVRLLDSLEPN